MTEVELEITRPAHGGHCVARLDGRVVFVRHTLPGEVVRTRLTDAKPDARFWRGEAIEVLQASPDRVPSAWPAAGPGGVGGGELAHVALAAQRVWKKNVLTEQLTRLGGVHLDAEVVAAPGETERGGLGYRTRIELIADQAGRLGMRQFRSHNVLPLTDMPLAVPAIDALCLFDQTWSPGQRIKVVAPSSGPAFVVTPTSQMVTEQVHTSYGSWDYEVPAAGFWQVHVAAPAVLVSAVLDAVGDITGRRVWDLYAGSGLFTLPLADAVGRTGSVTAVESAPTAELAVQKPQVTRVRARVEQWLRSNASHVDVVVLDPPRSGAGAHVINGIARANPNRIVYVACDPAALGRDTKTLGAAGYELAAVTGYDLFPMTHHVEAVAIFTR